MVIMTEVSTKDSSVSAEEERLRERLRAKKESKESVDQRMDDDQEGPSPSHEHRGTSPRADSPQLSSSSHNRRNRSSSPSPSHVAGDGSRSRDSRRRNRKRNRNRHRRERRHRGQGGGPYHGQPPPPPSHYRGYDPRGCDPRGCDPRHGPSPDGPSNVAYLQHGSPFPYPYRYRDGHLCHADGYDDRRRFRNDDYDRDDYGRLRRPSPGGSLERGRSRRRRSSRSSSASRSRSRSRSPSRKDRRRLRSRSRRSRSYSSASHSSSSGSSSGASSSSSSSNEGGIEEKHSASEYTKDQRTVFVSQLVQRANSSSIKKYFRKNGVRVREVIMLRDKRGKHKGCAYVELVRGEDVITATMLSNQVPDFQRFPILIKPSEAEKNHVSSKAQTSLAASQLRLNVDTTPLLDEKTGAVVQAQKVYVGSLSPGTTQEQLFVLFYSFGDLQKISMQMDSSTGVSKGFAFLQFRDPKSANLAIQSMNGQTLAGRPMKTGWASQVVPGANVVTSSEFPGDATIRTQQAYQVLAQLTVGVPAAVILSSLVSSASTTGAAKALNSASKTIAASSSGAEMGDRQTRGSRVPTVAEARAGVLSAPTISVAASPSQPKVAQPVTVKLGNADDPTEVIVVHNMFGSNESEEDMKEIHEEFDEETSQYGLIESVLEKGGKIYARFSNLEGAKTCAGVLQGRWFDKRQLYVEFIKDMPKPEVSS